MPDGNMYYHHVYNFSIPEALPLPSIKRNEILS